MCHTAETSKKGSHWFATNQPPETAWDAQTIAHKVARRNVPATPEMSNILQLAQRVKIYLQPEFEHPEARVVVS